MTLSKIRLLDEQTINKIAAGEVIENPSSVVKELVENAIDAESTTITIEIQEGGRELIRISDNGFGMSKEDALLSLERHATSKIREVEDIEALETMGFRGEAIPSIASISKFSLLTSNELNSTGTLLIAEGGRVLSCTNAARSRGTTIEVKSLFYNVPVRRKFQKSPSFDTQEILKILTLLAFANPKINFELISDQKTLLSTPHLPDQSTFHDCLSKQIEHILGKEVFTSLIPLNFTQGPYELKGFIGESHLHRPNRLGQFLFINQRSIYSPLISSAVREGYGSMLPNQRFPFFVIHLNMPGHLFDVNVHPQKKEVRLRQEFQLKEAVIEAVQQALRKQQSQNTFYTPINHDYDKSDDPSIPPCWNTYDSRSAGNAFNLPIKASEEKWEYKKIDSDANFSLPMSPELGHLMVSSEECEVEPTIFTLKKIPVQIPAVMSTIAGYLLIDPFHLNKELFRLKEEVVEGGLALVDQKAAYSRIFFEKLLNQKESNDIEPLLIPLTIQLTNEEARHLKEHLEILNNMGFSIREFGECTFMIDALPNFIKQDQVETCLSMLVQELSENQASRYLQKEKERQLALIACRASLPKMKRLSIEEGQGLMNQLMACEMPAQCPLGKPICFYLSTEDICKYFR